ncbi:MAG: hypothetical protein KJZ60_05960 [Ignavibacteriaceae bacterium]|nr:MAG: hypothetical protein EDM72_07410 [Chlorobiota bacterium]MCL4279219.1 hypothetical protein [Ignavibacteriaceae bacterium]
MRQPLKKEREYWLFRRNLLDSQILIDSWVEAWSSFINFIYKRMEERYCHSSLACPADRYEV